HEGEGPAGVAGLIEGLERRGPPDALVDPPPHGGEVQGAASPIDPPEPAELPQGIVPPGPFRLEEGLRFSVANLLLPVSPDRGAAVVPDDGCGSISDHAASIAQPPTQVDVVARDPEPWIESADRHERVLPEGHVAS